LKIINKSQNPKLNLKLNFTFELSLKTKIMVYKFRVILDAEEDIFRDIAILADDTLENTQCRSSILGFDGMEVASFLRETWNQEDEISL
jgi:hypothetical protein